VSNETLASPPVKRHLVSLPVDRLIRLPVRHDDPGVDACVLRQFATVWEFERLAPGEFEGCGTIATCRHMSPVRRAFVLDSRKKVAHRAGTDSVFIALGLDSDLAAENWPWVEGYAVHAATARRPWLSRI
jgi:hypothetical protein